MPEVEKPPAAGVAPSSSLAEKVPPPPPPKLPYSQQLRAQLSGRVAAAAAALNGHLDAAYRRLRGQEVLLLTLLCLCCTLLCVFVTHRQEGGLGGKN